MTKRKIRPEAYCATPGCIQVEGHAGLCTVERERREREEIEALWEIARAVVENGPDEGDRGYGCPHCYTLGTKESLKHNPGCAWVLARKLVGVP